MMDRTRRTKRPNSNAGEPRRTWRKCLLPLSAILLVSLAACRGDGSLDGETDDATTVDPNRGDAGSVSDTSPSPEPDSDPEPTPDPEPEPEPEPVAPGTCRSTVTDSMTSHVEEVCALAEGTVQHVRIEGIRVAPGFTSAQFFLGFDAAPSGPQSALTDGQFKLMLYGGTPTTIYAHFGARSVPFSGARDFTSASGATLCFDLRDGGDDRAPELVLWVDGENDADCLDVATLTFATAFGISSERDGSPQRIAKEKGAYFYQAGGIGASPTITLFDRGAASCEVLPAPTTEWQELCEPRGGLGHVRVEGIATSDSNHYFYVVVGEGEAPTGNPTTSAGDKKFILTGGRSNSGASWTWFRFSGTSTTQFSFAGEAGPLYVPGPTTVCADVGSKEGETHVAFWSTGAQDADCTSPSTLSPENALHRETWEGTLREDGRSFVKTNAAGVSVTRVVVSSQPMVP